MNSFSQELLRLRKELGEKSARAFFSRLKSKGVSFNYSYYMRLEQGGLPSEKVVREIASAMEGKGDSLILAYCRAQFPKHSYLFPENSLKSGKKSKENLEAQAEPTETAHGPQKELSPKQVAVLASRSECYHLFLLSTLARRPLRRGELAQLFAQKALDEVVYALKEAALLQETEEGLAALSVEARFPEPYTKELKLAFQQFDLWDESFGKEFQLESFLNKMQIRRVSVRYLALIHKHLELLFDLVRSSDEADSRYNDQVVQFKVQLRRGNLPG